MSAEHVKTILGRAVREPAFRSLLFRDPGQAIVGFDLTEAEIEALKRLTPENFDSMAAMLEERISKSSFAMEETSKSGREQTMKAGG